MKQLWMAFNILLVRLRFILVFVVVGLIVGNWAFLMNMLDKVWPRGQIAVAGDTEYFCPMDPGVVRDHPANCPICGMPLSKRKKGEKTPLPQNVIHRIQLSPFRVQQAGIRTDEVAHRLLVRDVRAVGTIVEDERRRYDVSARVQGRIEKLYKNFTGQEIKAGEPYAQVYSPELLATQEDLLRALKLSSDPASQSLLEAAHRRLELWGLTQHQINVLVREGKPNPYIDIVSPYSGIIVKRNVHTGHQLMMGEDVFEVADLTHVWMVAQVYEDEIALIKENQGVEVTSVAHGGTSFGGTVSFISPTLDPATRTVQVRVDIPNPDLALKPGMYVTARIKAPIGDVYVCCPGCPEIRSDAPGECPKCGMQLVKQGGVPIEPQKEYFCPHHPEVVAGAPGACPACGMALQEREKKEPDVRKIYVCDMHPDSVSDTPGTCVKPPCGGMVLEEKKILPGSKLVWRCPNHPESAFDKPGACPKDGHALHYEIQSEPRVLDKTFVCHIHPDRPLDASGACPDCGAQAKPMESAKHLAVPISAVVDSGDRKVVFVESRPGIFDMRAIDVGPRAGEYYPVLKGLAAGERVATAGAFLLDAEARLDPAAAAQYFGAADHAGHK